MRNAQPDHMLTCWPSLFSHTSSQKREIIKNWLCWIRSSDTMRHINLYSLHGIHGQSTICVTKIRFRKWILLGKFVDYATCWTSPSVSIHINTIQLVFGWTGVKVQKQLSAGKHCKYGYKHIRWMTVDLFLSPDHVIPHPVTYANRIYKGQTAPIDVSGHDNHVWTHRGLVLSSMIPRRQFGETHMVLTCRSKITGTG